MGSSPVVAPQYTESKIETQTTEKSEENPKPVNIDDFNTMQNLFKTNNMMGASSAADRKEDPFSVLSSFEKSSVPPMMNTYSGSKQAPGQDFNMANFGTTQQGNLGGGNFQAQEMPQPTSQVSFAKKKQPAATEDLIWIIDIILHKFISHSHQII